MREVEAKVATVLSDYEVALTAGRGEGVEEGQKVVISRRVDVTDPDTNEPLGSVLVPKLRMEIRSVQGKLSVAHVVERAPSHDPVSNVLSLRNQQPLVRITTNSHDERTGVVFVGPGALARIQIPDVSDAPF